MSVMSERNAEIARLYRNGVSRAELAETIILDRFTGQFVSAQYDFEADA